MADKYAQDGVNVKQGDSFSALAAEHCRQTYGNSPFVKVNDFSQGNFRGPRGFEAVGLIPGSCLTAVCDGVGTKVIISDAAGLHYGSGFDVLAMTSGDITRYGGLPLVHCNVLDVSSLGETDDPTNQACRQLLSGLHAACDINRMVMLGGETAELGVCVGSNNPQPTVKYNWAGFAIGAFHFDKMILGRGLKPGQVIMALKEDGFRSNGISVVRKAFELKFGPDWAINTEALPAIRQAAVPSVLYDYFLTRLNGWHEADFLPLVNLHLIAHVTGGSIKSKFARDILFPLGFSAVLDDLFDPPEIMSLCAAWRGMNDEECYDTWNGGQGALVVIDKETIDDFQALAFESRLTVKLAGRIVETPAGQEPQVLIKSKFHDHGSEIKIFPKKGGE